MSNIDDRFKDISHEERERIRLTEEYRLAVQQELAKSVPAKIAIVEKFLFPAALLLVTIGLTHYLVPQILDQYAKKGRIRQMQIDFARSPVRALAELESSFYSYEQAASDYWRSMYDLRIKHIEHEFDWRTRELSEESYREKARKVEERKDKFFEIYERDRDLLNKSVDKYRIWKTVALADLKLYYDDDEFLDRVFEEISEAIVRHGQSVGERVEEFKTLEKKLHEKQVTMMAKLNEEESPGRGRERLTILVEEVELLREDIELSSDFDPVYSRLEELQFFIYSGDLDISPIKAPENSDARPKEKPEAGTE